MPRRQRAALYTLVAWFCMLGAMLLIDCKPGSADAPPTAVMQRAMASTVLIRGDQGLGTGVCVRREAWRAWFLTAAHVVEAQAQIAVEYRPGGYSNAARVWAVDAAHDLALVYTPNVSSALAVAPLADEVPALGTPVFEVGNPLGYSFLLAFGNVSAAETRDIFGDEWPQLVVDMQGTGGQSGSGIFDYQGRVVGILRAGAVAGGERRLPTHITIATTSLDARSFIAKTFGGK